MVSRILFRFPVGNRSCLAGDVDTDLMQRPGIIQIGESVLLPFDLRKGFLCGAVQLEFKDVNVIVALYDDVRPALAVLLLNQDRVAGEQPVDDVKRILEMGLEIHCPNVFVCFIGDGSEKGGVGILHAVQIAPAQHAVQLKSVC